METLRPLRVYALTHLRLTLIRTTSCEVGAHRLMLLFVRAMSPMTTFKVERETDCFCVVYNLVVFLTRSRNDISFARSDPRHERCGTRTLDPPKGNVSSIWFFLSQILPSLITLRIDGPEIIAVMSSNVDDVKQRLTRNATETKKHQLSSVRSSDRTRPDPCYRISKNTKTSENAVVQDLRVCTQILKYASSSADWTLLLS